MTIETPTPVAGSDASDTPDPSRIIGYDFVDPNTLLFEDNVRRDRHDVSDLDPGLVASIAAHGVTQPIIVRRRASDDRLVVRLGKNRTRAARHVGRWVDVAIERKPATESDDVRDEQIERIVVQLAENQHRVDLSDADEVRAHGELMGLWEMSPDEIARTTHTDPERVRRTTTVASSKTAMDMLTQLDLGHLEVIAELDGDDVAVAELVNVALNQPAQFAHVAQRLRQARELAEAQAATARDLAEAGTRVVDPSEHEHAMELHNLRARAEDPDYSACMTTEEHAGCPGHAVSVEAWRKGFGATVEVDVLNWCLDPDTHGHVPVWAPSTATSAEPSGAGAAVPHPRGGTDGASPGASPDTSSGHGSGAVDLDNAASGGDGAPGDGEPDSAHPDVAQQVAAERLAAEQAAERVRQYDEALRRYQVELTRNRADAAQAAATVRREWLAGFLRRKTPPKDAARYIIEALVLWQVDFDDAACEGHDLACELLGMAAPQVDADQYDSASMVSQDLLTAARTATAARSTVLTLALVLAGQERAMGPHSWSHPTPGAATFLRRLEAWGYNLSPIERLMIDPNDAEITIDGDPALPHDPDRAQDAEDSAELGDAPGDGSSDGTDDDADQDPYQEDKRDNQPDGDRI